MKTRTGQMMEAETGRVLVARLEMADTVWKRGLGLLGRKRLAPDEGLWLEPCNSIHTFAMRFPIDALFLDKQGRVLKMASRVHPWRVQGPVRGARIVVELPAGTLETNGVQNGQRFFKTG